MTYKTILAAATLLAPFSQAHTLAVEDSPAPAAQTTPAPEAASPAFPATAFTLAYGGTSASQPVSLAALAQIPVHLSLRDGTYHAPAPDGTGATTVTLGQQFPAGTRFTPAALVTLFNAIVQHYNNHGIQGVFVVVDADDIDPQTHKDYRPATRTALRLVVWTSRVATLRTLARGDRFPDAAAINNPAHAHIFAHSPLNPPAATTAPNGTDAPAQPVAPAEKLSIDEYLRRPISLPPTVAAHFAETLADTHAPNADGTDASGDPALLRKAPLDQYLLRLNRHPSRRVDAAISAGTNPGDITLDYLVAEKRSWFAYAQVANTGTKSTNRYREHIGAAFYQLTDYDDTFQVDIGSASIDSGNSASLSYDRPLLFPDYLRLRPFASYGDFTARDLAYDLGKFKGSSTVAGLEAPWSPFRIGQFAFDIAPALSWQYYHIDNQSFNQKGDVHLLAPMLTFRLERNTDTMRTAFSLAYETSLPELISHHRADVATLGNAAAGLRYHLLRYDARHSMYIEPLLFGDAFYTGTDWNKSARAHELLVHIRGQHTLTNDPLIPQKRMTLGGMYSVRGYPESSLAADNADIATLEYRLHVPRLFRPYKTNDTDTSASAARHADASAPSYFGVPFNWRAPAPTSIPDWDLALCFFTDIGHASTQGESGRTLASIGIGLDLQFSSTLSARLDYGFVQKALRNHYDPKQDVQRGDSELHFSVALLW